MNIRKTNRQITQELNKIENSLNKKLNAFYNSNIKGSILPTDSLRQKYEQKVKSMIRKTVQESYLYGTKIVTKQISDINTEFVDFISVTDIQNIQQLTDKVNNQFWKTADRLHRRETEFILLPDKGLELKNQFDTKAAIIGFAAFASFLPFNNAVVSKMQSVTLDIGFDIQQIGELPSQGKVMYLTSEDAKVCDPFTNHNSPCEPYNRMIFDVKDPEIPEVPRHAFCRCTLLPLIDSSEAF